MTNRFPDPFGVSEPTHDPLLFGVFNARHLSVHLGVLQQGPDHIGAEVCFGQFRDLRKHGAFRVCHTTPLGACGKIQRPFWYVFVVVLALDLLLFLLLGRCGISCWARRVGHVVSVFRTGRDSRVPPGAGPIESFSSTRVAFWVRRRVPTGSPHDARLEESLHQPILVLTRGRLVVGG